MYHSALLLLLVLSQGIPAFMHVIYKFAERPLIVKLTSRFQLNSYPGRQMRKLLAASTNFYSYFYRLRRQQIST